MPSQYGIPTCIHVFIFQTTDDSLTATIRDMHASFNALLLAPDTLHGEGLLTHPAELTPGQMLLMGFNGLFTRLGSDFDTMLERIQKIQVPDIWRKVDVIKEARALKVVNTDSETLELRLPMAQAKVVLTVGWYVFQGGFKMKFHCRLYLGSN